MGTWGEGMDNWLLAYLMSSVLSHDSAYKKRGMPLYTQCRNLNPWRPDRPAKCYPGRTLCVGLFTPAVHSCKGHHQVQDNGRSNGLKMKRMWGVLIESQWKKSPYFNSTIYIWFFFWQVEMPFLCHWRIWFEMVTTRPILLLKVLPDLGCVMVQVTTLLFKRAGVRKNEEKRKHHAGGEFHLSK